MFVGQVTRDIKDREAFQEIDYRAVFGSMTKWATEIDDPARMPEIVSRAFYTATSGRPGPVVIGPARGHAGGAHQRSRTRPRSAGRDLAGRSRNGEARGTAGERAAPLVVVGGTRWRRTPAPHPALRRAFELPVTTSYRRAPLFDPLHPCYAGDLGSGPIRSSWHA